MALRNKQSSFIRGIFDENSRSQQGAANLCDLPLYQASNLL
jgi:hypothetical protein